MQFPTLTPPFIITSIMLAVAYVIFVVLTTIDNDYRNVDSRCKFEFMILKYAGYGALYLAAAMAVFFMKSNGAASGKLDVVDYLGYVVALLVTGYAVVTSYIHIHSLRKFKQMKTGSDAGKKHVGRTIESLSLIFTSRSAFCDQNDNKANYARFCETATANTAPTLSDGSPLPAI